jgi:hypothetical protein
MLLLAHNCGKIKITFNKSHEALLARLIYVLLHQQYHMSMASKSPSVRGKTLEASPNKFFFHSKQIIQPFQ